MISIIDLIRENKNAISDITGSKPLVALAEQVKSNTAKISDNDIVDQIIHIDYNNLSVVEMQALLIFLQYSKIMKPALLNGLIKIVMNNLTDNSKETINKKGLILRYITLSDKSSVSADLIFNDKNLFKFNPWLWFDIALILNTSKAFEGIKSYFIKNGTPDDIQKLIDRLPFIMNKINRSDYIVELSDLLITLSLKEDFGRKELLDKWIKNFKIERMKLASISKLNKASLQSKSVLN